MRNEFGSLSNPVPVDYKRDLDSADLILWNGDKELNNSSVASNEETIDS